MNVCPPQQASNAESLFLTYVISSMLFTLNGSPLSALDPHIDEARKRTSNVSIVVLINYIADFENLAALQI